MKKIICATCQVEFEIPDSLYERRQGDGDTFYCPNGHPNIFKESLVTKLSRELAQIKENLASYTSSFEYQKKRVGELLRSNTALRAVITRLKNQREKKHGR